MGVQVCHYDYVWPGACPAIAEARKVLDSLQGNKASEAVLLENRIGECQLAHDISNTNVAAMNPDKFLKTVNALAMHQDAMPQTLWLSITSRTVKIEFENAAVEAMKDIDSACELMAKVMRGLCFWDDQAGSFNVSRPTFLDLLPHLRLAMPGVANPSDDKAAAFDAVFGDTEASEPKGTVAEQQVVVKAAGRAW